MSSFLFFLRLPYRGHFAVAVVVAVGKNDRIPGSGVDILSACCVSTRKYPQIERFSNKLQIFTEESLRKLYLANIQGSSRVVIIFLFFIIILSFFCSTFWLYLFGVFWFLLLKKLTLLIVL